MGKISALDYIIEYMCILERSGLLSFIIITNTDSIIHVQLFTEMHPRGFQWVFPFCVAQGMHERRRTHRHTHTKSQQFFVLPFPKVLSQ